LVGALVPPHAHGVSAPAPTAQGVPRLRHRPPVATVGTSEFPADEGFYERARSLLRLTGNLIRYRIKMLFHFYRRFRRAATWAPICLMSLGAYNVGCSAAGDTSASSAPAGTGPESMDAGPGLSQSCAGPESPEVRCQPGLTCIHSARDPSFASCDYPVDNPPGGCCEQNVDCMADEICSGGMCVPNTSGRCSTSPLMNARCAQGYVCVQGGAGEMNHCAENPNPVPLGGNCTDGNSCASDAFCRSGQCVLRIGDGEPCARTPPERQCKVGLECDDVNENDSIVSICRPTMCSPVGRDL
jgi:hypothetical protein